MASSGTNVNEFFARHDIGEGQDEERAAQHVNPAHKLYVACLLRREVDLNRKFERQLAQDIAAWKHDRTGCFIRCPHEREPARNS